MYVVLLILAVILIVAGVIDLLNERFARGAVLIILGLLIGPGGISIFH